jgi:Ca2+-binding EF-hand superfamily protein
MKKFWTWVLVAACSAVLTSPALAAGKGKKEKPSREQVFKKLDKDNSGSLSLQEFTGKRDPAKAEKAFKRLDKDGNNELSLEEFSAKPKKKKGK